MRRSPTWGRDAAELVDGLAATAGTSGFPALLGRLEEGGDEVGDAVFAWLTDGADDHFGAPGAHSGTRDHAYDAIEAIVTREGLPDEPLGPHGRQLIGIRRPGGSRVTVEAVHVREDQDVTIGTELATLRVDGEPLTVTAPHRGVVVTVGVGPRWTPRPVMFRLRRPMVLP